MISLIFIFSVIWIFDYQDFLLRFRQVQKIEVQLYQQSGYKLQLNESMECI